MKTNNALTYFTVLICTTSLFNCINSYTVEQVKIDFSKPIKTFTAGELKKYDGSQEGKPIYMAIKGVVFDVSAGRDFYGKGTAYNALAGLDCSRAVAKMSLDASDLNNDLTGLTDQQLKSLDDTFKGTYVAKYPIAGYMNYLVREQKLRQQQVNDEL